MNLRIIRAVARKEYYHLIRDFRSLYLALIIPLLLILLFGYALSLDVEHIPMAVVDHDRTPQSLDFIRKLDATIYFDVVADLPDTAALVDYLDRNRALVGIVLPPGWSADLKADRLSPLQVVIDGSDPNYAGNTRAFVMAYVSSVNQEQLLAFLNRQGRTRINAPVAGRIRVWFNEDLESSRFIIPGIIAVIIMIVGALLTSLVIAREYENGTMEQLIVTPLKSYELILGKTIPFIIVAQAQMVMVIVFAVLWFQIPLVGSIPLPRGPRRCFC